MPTPRRMERAFVTGAAGLIGSNLVADLTAHGYAVRAMVRRAPMPPGTDATLTQIVQADVLDPVERLAELMDGCDTLFHAAAHFAYCGIAEADLVQTAVQGTRNVLAAAARAGIGRVVVTSSSVVFGSSAHAVWRDETAQPEGDFQEPAYVSAKVAQHEAARALADQLGLELVLVCPTMSVGPRAASLGPSNAIIVAYLSDPLRMTFPGGCNIVSVQDVARCHWLAALWGDAGASYLVGAQNLTWRQIHTLIAELCGVPPPQVEIGHAAAYLAASAEELRARLLRRAALTSREQARMAGRYYWYSHEKAATLGFQPREARVSLARACAWLAASDFISREVRATMRLHPDVQAARRCEPLSQGMA